MSRKITVFIPNILFALIIGVLALGFGGIFSTSIHVACELQNDGTYICQVQDTLFGWAFSEKSAEHVIGLEQRVKCSGSGSRRGCSQISEFTTTTGEKVQLSHLFTTGKSRVTDLVNTVNDLMKTKSTSIDYTSDTSPRLIFNVCLSSFIFIMFLGRAFLRLSPGNNGDQSIATVHQFGHKHKKNITEKDWVQRRNAFIDLESEGLAIRETGEEALATILETEDLHVATPEEKKEGCTMRLKFNVIPKTGAPFVAETYGMIANESISKLTVGKKVYVKYDVRYPAKAALIRSAE